MNNNKNNGYLLIISAVILWSLSGLLVKNVTATPFWEIILLLFSGIVISGISYALYGSGLRQVTMERALIICLAEPILNPIWVYLGNGEKRIFKNKILNNSLFISYFTKKILLYWIFKAILIESDKTFISINELLTKKLYN